VPNIGHSRAPAIGADDALATGGGGRHLPNALVFQLLGTMVPQPLGMPSTLLCAVVRHPLCVLG